MFDIFAQYATDNAAENDGRWFDLSSEASVLVARAGNDKYNAALRRKREQNQLDLDAGGPTADKIAEQIFTDLMADTVLLGWKGLGYQGKEVDYSPEMSRTMLGIKDFRRKIEALSSNMENFRVKLDGAQGNV